MIFAAFANLKLPSSAPSCGMHMNLGFHNMSQTQRRFLKKVKKVNEAGFELCAKRSEANALPTIVLRT